MSEKTEPKIAFSTTEGVDATKDFIGIIVDAEYGTDPLGMVGKAEFEKRAQLAIEIHTDAYEKNQFEWYSPTNVNKTKWMYFVTALQKCGAIKDIVHTGKTVAEQMMSFANSLKGMKFRFLEQGNLESAGQTPIKRLLLPEEYLGRVEIPQPVKVETQEVKLE